MNNTINVPRGLLADLLGNDHDKRIMAERHSLAMLANAPLPTGVDGLEVVGYVSQDDIKWQGDCTLRLKPYNDYVIPLCRLSDAQAIIDGLRGELKQSDRARMTQFETIGKLQDERDTLRQQIAEARYEITQHSNDLALAYMKGGADMRQQRDRLAQILRDLVPGCKWRIMRPRIDAALAEIDNGN